ncbi:MAG: hypothetical protein ABI679_06800 [Gemmatimonadota bacterium]
MADDRARTAKSGGLIAVVLVLILGLALSFWLFTRGNRTSETALVDQPTTPGDSTQIGKAEQAVTPGQVRRDTGLGAGVAEKNAATATSVFAGRDIHDVPLGTILTYAQSLTYSEERGMEKTLAPNAKGQSPTVKIWPEAGASSLEDSDLGRGRIVARIQSSGSYDNLGLAGGLNYLWVESRPDGGYRGVIIPATAFSPMHDLNRLLLTEKTPSGVPLEKGASWITRDGNDVPWIACGRC